ncbi:MAG: aminotransferase class III-fold pyridoxal phosphate-dependent enzyme [Rhodobacteraceae bacterium]|nr:aminotransferase class III-fold pyridoxal phosphate-dependent enzyme [Paracoccaceae bacterium]
MFDSNFLRENNAKFNWHPMGHPADGIKNPPPIFIESMGVRIKDIEGNEVIDAVGGLWNVNLGYSNQPVKDAIINQLNALPYYSTFKGSSNDKVIELSYLLKEFFRPEGMVRSFFTSGGSDSVETALRLARQYHKIRGEANRTKFISVKFGYHGTHFGGASVNGNSRFREAYEPLLPGCFHIPSPNAYQNPFNESDPEKLSTLCLGALEDEILFQGKGTVAAFIMEPIQGAGGLIVPPDGFYKQAREICARHGVLFIADEVITGFGRTGEWSGSRLWDIKPDMMTIAKAITSGYFPFGATMVSEGVAEVFEGADPEAGAIGHGYTYTGHPVGAAAGIVCLEETKRLKLKDNARERGQQLYDGLRDLARKMDVIGDVRGGKGLMTGMELVSDRSAKTPLDNQSMAMIHQKIYESGVNVRIAGHKILMSPPLIISSEEVDHMLYAFSEGLSVV